MVEPCSCNTSDRVVLVFPCSGSSDVGELADRSARNLDRAGTAQMYCLAGLGGRVTGIVTMTKAAGFRLAIDGCAVGCASKILEQAKVGPFRHVCVTDLGFEKGGTDVTEAAVAAVARAAEEELLA
ncbi:MAG: putative zinc-binding protein [Candidatus Bipolaricaulota bacterium]|nr:putative zinc-binding protein [Candidatus Bipolaricaulota bacterium]